MNWSTEIFTNASVVPLAEDNAIKRIRNAQPDRPELLFNSSEENPYLCRKISITEIETIVAQTERDLLSVFIDRLLAEKGPVVAGLFKTDDKNVIRFIRKAIVAALRGKPVPKIASGGSRLDRDERAHLDSILNKPIDEQRRLLKACLPGSFSKLGPLIAGNPILLNQRFIECSPSATGIADPIEWIGRLQGVIAQQDRKYGYTFPLLVALRLRSAGAVLWPASTVLRYRQTVGNMAGSLLVSEFKELTKGRWPRLTEDSGLSYHTIFSNGVSIAGVLFRTSLEREDEISWEAVAAFRGEHGISYTASGRFSRNLMELAKEFDPNGHKLVTVEDPWARRIRAYLGNADNSGTWMKAFAEYRQQVVNVKNVAGKSGHYRFFIEWLRNRFGDGALPGPTEITRQMFRNDMVEQSTAPLTFWQHLTAKTSNRDGKELSNLTRNQTLFELRAFFQFIADTNIGFRNPMLESDRYVDRRMTKAGHARIPSHLLASIRDFIIERDEKTQIPIGWKKNVHSLKYCQAEVRRADGTMGFVFCPVMPAVLWILAEWPLRSSQALWLDSGELDEFRYNAASRKFEENPRGIKGRDSGVITAALDDVEVGDGFGRDHHVDFQVIRNKRPKTERSDYTIPYMDGDTIWVIQQVIDWQTKYGSAPVLVKESEQERTLIDPNGDLTEIVALFRLPQNQGKFPPAGRQISYFWQDFCGQYDAVYLEKPNWPRLVAKSYYTKSRGFRSRPGRRSKQKIETTRKVNDPVYDLHCLRVGGISERLSRGMPLSLVAGIAGHRSLAMTLYYFKEERQYIRKRMSDFLKTRPELRDACGRMYKLIVAEDEETISGLVGNVELLRKHLQQKVAIRVDTRGICPGTDCSEGLKGLGLHSRAVGSLVPEGFCPLCQFWITGFVFLPGMVKWFNEMIELLVKATRRQKTLYEEMLVYDTEGREDRVVECRNESDRIDQVNVVRSLAAERLFELIIEIFKDAEKRNGSEKQTGTSLIFAGGAKIRPALEQLGSFEKLREMSLMDHLLPSQTSPLAEEVNYELALRQARALGEYGGGLIIGLPLEVQRTANLALGELLERTVPIRSIEDVFEGKRRFAEILNEEESCSIRTGIENVVANLANADRDELRRLRNDPVKALEPPRIASSIRS